MFKNINATVSNVELSSNTFAKVYVAAKSGYIAAKHCGTADVMNNLFYTPDYATLVGEFYTGIIYATDTNTSNAGIDADTAAANSAGFTFTSNLAYYSTAVPSKKLKCSYYYLNDGKGWLYNKTEDPLATANFTNGVFTTKEAYASYGAKR